jgi:putative peptidoglycan lipid II flippase
MNKPQSLMKAAWIIAFVTVISKFMGFLRDVVTANYYGAGLTSDAYFYAYQIPALSLILLGGVGGPFHSATVAIFAKLIPSSDSAPDEKVQRLYNTFITTTFILFSIIGILVFIFSEQIMGFIVSNGNTALIHLSSMHLRVMTPVIVIGGIVGTTTVY